MKIKGWDKISGFTYKGYCIVNPIHNADETKYEATILNLNLPQKPKWELSVLTPAFKFNTKDTDSFNVMMWSENKLHTTTKINKQAMCSISHFRQTVEQLIDRMLRLELTSAPAVGIINHINNNGITYKI
jgi:hypothetical protein